MVIIEDLVQLGTLHQISRDLKATVGIAHNRNTGTYGQSAEAQGNYTVKGKLVKK